MKILILEDDPRVLHFLENALQAEGHQTQSCSTLKDLREQLASGSNDFEVAIFDRLINHEDSLDSLTEFKKRLPQTRIMLLSAINNATEKAQALDRGADDYMGKPYSFQELAARVRVLGRRSMDASDKENSHLILRADLVIDTLTQKVTVRDQRLDLSAKEFRLLLCLARRAGQIYSKYQLLDQVWDVQADIESNVVESTIRNLRKKLSEVNARVEILSKRNIGYWIEA